MYKTLGFKWLHEVFCPAFAFVTADREVARNPQRFIHVTVSGNYDEQNSPYINIVFIIQCVWTNTGHFEKAESVER